VAAKLDGYLKPQSPKDQYKCLIGVKDARKFEAKYGALLMSRLSTMTMMTAKEVGFVDIDAPGKVVCYTELSGLPLPSLKALDQWYVSYRSEDKIPVHTHRSTSTFVHARELTLDELASRAEDFKLFVQAVALGVLKRTERGEDTGLYSVTKRGRTQSIGDEKKLRLIGIPEVYRPIIREQVDGDLEKLTSSDQLAIWVALLEYYAVSVYPLATFRSDGVDVDRKSLPTLMCEKLVEDWTRRLELTLGQGAAERLLRTASDVVRDWTIEIPGSTSDVYQYEVNMRDLQNKRVLLNKVLQPGWGLSGVSQSQTGIGIAGGPPPIPQIQVHVVVNGQQAGPFDINTLKEMFKSGRLTKDSLVWMEGMASWAAASTVSAIASVFGAIPPPLPPA
jgi:hypothetical protein